MYTDRNFRTKSDLFRALYKGAKLGCYQPGGIFPEPWSNCNDPERTFKVTLEGPHYPQPHRWYAKATVNYDGILIDVEGYSAFKRKLDKEAFGYVPEDKGAAQ